MKKGLIVKHKETGRLYEVVQVEQQGFVLCYLLSAYDGMPIGELVRLSIFEVF